MTYNPNASHNLTYPNSNRPASPSGYVDAAPAGSYLARLRGEVAMCVREFGEGDDYTQAAEKRLHDHLMLVDDEYRQAFEAQQEVSDACPQCHGPVHESGFCPSCEECVA